MQTFELNGYDLVLVDVPEGDHGFFLHNGHLYTDDRYKAIWYKKLPPGSWSILSPGTADKCSEDEAAGIVEYFQDSNDSSYDPQYNVTTYFNVYKDYQYDDDFDTAIESLHSFIRMHKKEPGKIVICYRKKN